MLLFHSSHPVSYTHLPPVYTAGGRFNRQGISYLYLADTIETCLAEVHLQIGQNCSVGKFKCKQEIEVIDLTK